MGRVVIINQVTLDGVVTAAGTVIASCEPAREN